MNVRLLITLMSVALIFSIGSSATATTNYSHPQFSVTEDRALSLRETGSQIVIDAIENAFRVAGVEVFGGGFQLDSSIGYDLGDVEGIRGEVDAVIPLLHYGKHVLFAQPGAVFWTGIEKEERIDGNFGLVYRTELTRDLIGGVSFFYDQDFQIGHSRAGGGIDLQSGSLLLGANYYHVLSEVEDGREGFIEEAVDGMDLRLAIEKEIVRAEASVGYWDYTGEESGGQEDPQSGWQTSMGIDFGVRVMPGVFVEAGWEKHKDDLVLDERIFAGLAFRFSLPDLQGASYGDGSMSANLYKIVDREKRVLYEERVAGPTASIVHTGSESVAEGDTVEFQIQLSEALTEDVTLNLVGTGSAMYGSSNDYTVSVGGTACTEVTENNCQVMIAAGDTSANVTISIVEGEPNELVEDINLSMAIASAGNTKLMLGNSSLSFTISADPQVPTVSLSYVSTTLSTGEIEESRGVDVGGFATMRAQLSRTLSEDVTLNVGGSSTLAYSSQWIVSAGAQTCPDINNCQFTITAGQTEADVSVIGVSAGTGNITVSISIASAGSTGLVEGSPSEQTITLQ